MITKILEIITNTGKAEKDIENLSSEVETLNTGLEKTNTEVGGLKKGGKAFDTLKKGAKGVAGGFKMMGTALKAAGIGLALAAFGLLKQLFEENQKVVDLALAAFGLLKQLFEENQKVVDAFNIAFEALSIAFNDFFNYISKNVGAISGFFKKIFDDPLESVKALGNAIKENIIERVKSALEVFGFLGKAMKKLFAGDFKGAIDEVKNAGSEFVDVLTGVDNSVEKATEIISDGVDALVDYTKSTVEAATANVELKKQAELAAVANQGLIEKYDLQAESLRQIRDDERLSIEERKKANDELALVLDQQEKAMLSNAQISLRAARAELKKDKNNIEFKKAVMEAENELAAVRAQVAGFRSEQQSNDLALSKEELEMSKSKLESENNLSIERKRFNAEQIKDEKERLLALQKIDAEEAEIGRTRLNNEIELYKEGTQAKVDAEIALAEFEEEIYQQKQQKVNRSNELSALELSNEEQTKKTRQENLDAFEIAAQTTMNALIAINELTQAFAKEDEASQKKAFEVNKAIGIANAIINTSVGVSKALASSAPPLNFINAAIVTAAGVAQVKNIQKTKFDSSSFDTTSPSTSTGGGSATSPTQPPSFNVVGQSGFNQVAGALGQQQPVQAFVVAGDVTTAQQLQNNTITQATF
jgi:hypothetical protein